MYSSREPNTISVLLEIHSVQFANDDLFFSEGSRPKRSRILEIRCGRIPRQVASQTCYCLILLAVWPTKQNAWLSSWNKNTELPWHNDPSSSRHKNTDVCGNPNVPVWTNTLSPVITSCAIRFSIQQFYVLPHTVYLCVLCGSENKQRLFPYTALTDWFV